MINKKVKGFLAIFSMFVGTLTGCSKNSDFDPSLNENVEIYGPPEMFEQNIDTEVSEDVSEGDALEEMTEEQLITDEYEPEDNVPICIYGPPEMFDERENSENE